MIGERVIFIPEVDILKSMPGVGLVYEVMMAVEIGNIERFPSANHFISYDGAAPKK